jgi:MraZ protein
MRKALAVLVLRGLGLVPATAAHVEPTPEKVPADSVSRITLSAEHRRYANLTKECVVIGSMDFLEIWDAQAWQDYQQTHEETFSAASDETLRDII